MTAHVPGEDKIATIAILLGAPLTDRHFARLGVRELSRISDVIVVDCMRLVGRNPDHVTANMVDWPNYVTASTRDELRDILSRYSPQYAFDDVGASPETAFLGEIARQNSVKLVCIREGRLPRPSLVRRLRLIAADRSAGLAPTNSGTGADRTAAALVPRTLIQRILSRLVQEYRRRTDVPRPDVALLAGTDALDWYARRAPQHIWIASNDYHAFQHPEAAPESLPKPYAVFIDVCLPLAADWKLLGMTPPIAANDYYPLLRGLFQRIEELAGNPVVVAGHPNSRAVSNYVDLLGGRQPIFGQTSELVRHSSLVLSHASTATSFVAMAEKPVMFVSSKSIDRTTYGAHVRAMARSLNGPVVMLEESDRLTVEQLPRSADVAASRRYVNRYLRAPWTTESSPWQAFGEFLVRQHQRRAA